MTEERPLNSNPFDGGDPFDGDPFDSSRWLNSGYGYIMIGEQKICEFRSDVSSIETGYFYGSSKGTYKIEVYASRVFWEIQIEEYR